MLLAIIAALLATAGALPTAAITTSTKPEFSLAAASWLSAVTYSLLCYDMVIVAVFVWCWVGGMFWWMKRERGMGVGWHGGEWMTIGRREMGLEREMRRVGCSEEGRGGEWWG